MLEETLNDRDLINKLNEVLENKKSILKISVDEEDKIKIEEIRNDELSVNEENKKVPEKEEVLKIKKVAKSFFKIFEELIDSVAKNFLKKKYKINNSVYNDGKKAVQAIQNKDSKTFLKKATDAILNLIKKIPTDKKKIIKNTKNIAIDEIYSWKQ